MRTPLVAAALLALALAPPSLRGEDRFARSWQELTPEEQRRAWETYQRYRQLPAPQQRSLERRYREFHALPPQEQERLRQNYERYRELEPGERREYGEKYRRWKRKRQ
jgi:hypothetical protein